MVVDTDAYSRVYLAISGQLRHSERAAERQALIDALPGRTVVIALQTRAELLTFPAMGGLGGRRAARLLEQVDRTPTTRSPVTSWTPGCG